LPFINPSKHSQNVRRRSHETVGANVPVHSVHGPIFNHDLINKNIYLNSMQAVSQSVSQLGSK